MRYFPRRPPRDLDVELVSVRAAAPDAGDVELSDELVERVRVRLARDRAIILLGIAPPDVWPTSDVLDDFLAEVVR
jgi:hypothetical protein